MTLIEPESSQVGIDHHRIKILPNEIRNVFAIWFIRVLRLLGRNRPRSDIAYMLVEHPVILPFLLNARRAFSMSIDFVRPGEDFSSYRKVIIPNGMWPIVADATNSIPREKRIYCEIGFLPQTKNVYFDTEGVHGHSSIRTAALPELGAPEKKHLDAAREAFKRQNFVRVKWDSVDLSDENHEQAADAYDFDFYFVPLQLARDTAFALCPFDSNQEIIDYVQRAMPDARLIFKTHPLDPQPGYTVNDKNILLPPQNKDLRQLLLRCQAVIASNSTVILEALMLHKKCATYGIGFTTNHHVTLECHEELDELRSIGQWQPDWEKVDRFLWLLLERQVSIDFRTDKKEKDKLARIFRQMDLIKERGAPTQDSTHLVGK
ncbi:MAG: hypothetical protein NXI15_14920 [Gammaproteobacteria bacterium]|jgi:hypothetical protein|nr:hypothetical protein [Gammaproteobacteria bacterium]